MNKWRFIEALADTKGQFISKCPFGVFKSPKKPTELDQHKRIVNHAPSITKVCVTFKTKIIINYVFVRLMDQFMSHSFQTSFADHIFSITNVCLTLRTKMSIYESSFWNYFSYQFCKSYFFNYKCLPDLEDKDIPFFLI